MNAPTAQPSARSAFAVPRAGASPAVPPPQVVSHLRRRLHPRRRLHLKPQAAEEDLYRV